MDRLRLMLTLAIGVPLTGTLIAVALALSWYGWAPIVVSALVGFGLAWSAARLTSRRTRRRDPRKARRAEERERRAPKV